MFQITIAVDLNFGNSGVLSAIRLHIRIQIKIAKLSVTNQKTSTESLTLSDLEC
jgi:hypothetical protein